MRNARVSATPGPRQAASERFTPSVRPPGSPGEKTAMRLNRWGGIPVLCGVTRRLAALFALFVFLFVLCTARAASAQYQGYGPPFGPPKPVTIHDWGLTQSAQSRVALRSGFLVGPSLAFSARSSTLSQRDTTVIELMELTALASPLDRRMGFRIAPFSFGASFWSESVFTNVYARWTIVELGSDNSGDGWSAIAASTNVVLGVSQELNDDVALRLELGSLLGVYARSRGRDETVPYLDVGGVLSLGLVIR